MQTKHAKVTTSVFKISHFFIVHDRVRTKWLLLGPTLPYNGSNGKKEAWLS